MPFLSRSAACRTLFTTGGSSKPATMSRPISIFRTTRVESAIDQKCRDVAKKVFQDLAGRGTELAFLDRLIHQQHPAITGGLIDCEGRVASTQGRMPSLLQIVLRTTKAKCQKHPQSFFSTRQIMGRIHGPQQIVGRNAAIKGSRQPLDAVGAQHCVQIVFGHRGTGGAVGHGSIGGCGLVWAGPSFSIFALRKIAVWSCHGNHQMQKFISSIDHLVVTAPSLESGAAWIQQQLGCALQPGGRHPRMGTHNQLLRIGPDCYLEVLAIDPAATPPKQPRWFGLDHAATPFMPRLTAWVMRTNHIHELAPLAPAELGPIQSMQRGDLEWLITIPETGACPFDGLLPPLIQWQTSSPPAARLPESPLTLQSLQLRHPEADRLREWFDRAGLTGPIEVIRSDSGTAGGLTASFRRATEAELVKLGNSSS